MLSKKHFFFCVFSVLFCLLWWVFVCLVRFPFFVWHSCRDMAWIMLTEAFKGKSCSSFFAAVGAFAACSGMQERSIMGQWTLEGSASTLHQVWPSREMVVERGLADKVKFSLLFLFCSFDWCHFNIYTLCTPGKTVKALRHQPWAVMLVCPRWFVWCMDLSPCSWVAQAQWGNTLAVHAAGNRGVSQLLESRIYFSFGTWF